MPSVTSSANVCSLRTRRTERMRSTARNLKKNTNIASMKQPPLPKHPKIHLPLADRIVNTILSILLLTVVWPVMVIYVLLRRRKLTRE